MINCAVNTCTTADYIYPSSACIQKGDVIISDSKNYCDNPLSLGSAIDAVSWD